MNTGFNLNKLAVEYFNVHVQKIFIFFKKNFGRLFNSYFFSTHKTREYLFFSNNDNMYMYDRSIHNNLF